MRKRLIAVLITLLSVSVILTVVYVLFFKDTSKTAYYIVSETLTENSHTGVICTGTYLYDYDYTTGEVSNKRLAEYSDTRPSLYLINSDSAAVFSPVDDFPYTYRCTLESVSWYIQWLEDNRYTLTELTTDYDHIDAKLTSSRSTVRIVWTPSEVCTVICQDSGKNYTDPPYINE